ncbi:TPA: hypothetical protein ACI1IR_004375 [Yersinia enterocolitica]
MLNLKVTTLVVFLVASAGIGAAGSAIVMKMTSIATADATAVLNCKPSAQPAEKFRHADPVNTGRNKEY